MLMFACNDQINKRNNRFYNYNEIWIAWHFKGEDIGVFAGTIKFDRLSRTDRMLMKRLGFVEGDFRDWDAIKAWGGKMAGELLKKD